MCKNDGGGRVCNSYRDYSVGSDAHFHLLMELIPKRLAGTYFIFKTMPKQNLCKQFLHNKGQARL